MPSADFSHAVRIDPSTLSQFQSHATSQGTWEISRGKTQNLPCVDAGFIKHTPCGWRTSLSRANSSRVYHTSYPVPVRRPACSDWTSSGPHLAVTPLSFSLPSAPLTPGIGTSTLLALCHARHTRFALLAAGRVWTMLGRRKNSKPEKCLKTA